MKLIHKNGELHLVSDGEKEQKELLKVFLKDFFDTAEPAVVPTVGKKSHKKHNFKKECPACGLSFKGIQGLNRHRVVHKKETSNDGMVRLPVMPG